MARDVASVVGLVTRQLSPEVQEAMEEDKMEEGDDDGEERDWTLSFLDTLVLESLAKGQVPYKPRNTKADSVENSSVSLLPANHTMGSVSAGLTESMSMDMSSLNSSENFSSSREEPATLWTSEGRLEASSPTFGVSVQTPPPSEPLKSSVGLDGLLEEGWS